MTQTPPTPSPTAPAGDPRAQLHAQAWQGEVDGLRQDASRAFDEVLSQVAKLQERAPGGAFADDVVLAHSAARQLVIAAAELQARLAGLDTAHRLRFARPAAGTTA